ncbi:MAG TPA: hypothetical protein VKU82_11425 [Planctomycetaceae bacterium]|nr:hypothetical protein [Planctomycetaceae bacterium]
MPGIAPFAPVLADNDAIIGGIVALITIVGWLINLFSNKNQKGPPVANRPRPPVRPRDERLQQEISIFIEDLSGQRGKGGAPRPAAGVGKPAIGTPPAAAKRRSTAAAPGKSARRPRPGEDIAARHAPTSETLGTAVKQHLTQHMTERVSQDMQQRLAPRVEEKIAQDLGPAVTAGPSARQTPAPSGAAAPGRADRFGELLRNPASLRQAIVLNLILSPPAARTRSSGR